MPCSHTTLKYIVHTEMLPIINPFKYLLTIFLFGCGLGSLMYSSSNRYMDNIKVTHV